VGSLEYAHARLSARYGQRPREGAWQRIEHLREMPALLDAARASALGAWLAGIDAASTPHEIERTLRTHWREHVEEVARWMPDEWRGALRWWAVAVDLAVVQHLARGGAALPWMDDDAVYRELGEREAAGFGAPPVGGSFAPLTGAWAEPARIDRAWLAEWRRRLPSGAPGPLLDELVRVLRRHFGAFREPTLSDGWPLRRALEARLALLYRRAILDPAAAFVYLTLAALDLERLRGELVRRAAFRGLALVA